MLLGNAVFPRAEVLTLLAAIHGFVPALPWLVYRLTQAPVHAFVMHCFGRYLARTNPSVPAFLASGESATTAPARTSETGGSRFTVNKG